MFFYNLNNIYSNNHYYEKFEDGTINDITQEIPFEIPDSWRWVHFGELFYTQSGLSYKKDNLSIISDNMYTIFRGGNIGDGEYFYRDDDLQISEQFIKDKTILKKNCFITPSVTSIEHIGKIALIDTDLDNTVAGGFVLIIYPILEDKNLLKYFLYALSSKYHKDNCKKITNKSGQAFYNISREKLMQLLVPLPPLMEQKRISKKIKLFLPYINNYNNIYSKLETLNTNYKEKLKKSILQYAIQGKLVKQDLNDEPAEVLINKILEEKRVLIKTNQIKKENLSIIYKDSTDNQFYEKFDDGSIVNITNEIPFEIPINWTWTKLRNIGVYKKGPFGSALTKSMFVPKSNETIKVYEQKNAIQKNATLGEYYITKDYFERSLTGFEIFPNDIIVSCAGTIGETYVMPNEMERGIINQALMRMRILELFPKDYFLLYFDYVLKKSSAKKSSGSAIKNIPPFDIFKEFLVAVPPIAEQKRILGKLNIMFNIIKTAE